MKRPENPVIRFVFRTVQVLLLAFMLGLWNTMMQDTRMINDTATRITLDAEDSDDPLD
ncbi:MAG: hypothetical protein QF371_08860 [Flavobacteriales bacterium]|nr:hypothetical protein [Flavobacteriales bacterium]